jgi:kynurenine formamidase
MFIDLSLSLPADHPIFKMATNEPTDPLSLGHVGTHLDTYLQVPIPVDWCDRRGVLVDARAYGPIVPPDVIATVDIREGDFVIFRTDRIEQVPYGTREYFTDHPILDWALIRALLGRKVSFIGIDASGIRHGVKLGDEHYQADVECEQSHCYVIENLTNLASLPDTARAGFPIRLGWIQHRGASGVAVKVVANV